MRNFNSDFDRDLYRSLSILNVIYPDIEFVIGGFTSLYLQGINFRLPNDIELIKPMDKRDFLDYVYSNDIDKPEGLIKYDWSFHPDVYQYSTVIELNWYNLIIKLQSVEDIIGFKEEFLDLDFSDYKKSKHVNDLKLLTIK